MEFANMRPNRILAGVAALAAALALAACGGGSSDSDEPAAGSSAGSAAFPVTIKHALGSTTIEKKPERVATVQWANQEVPLALGITPVGMAAANFGDDNGDGVLPWVTDKLKELGSPTPVLFDENDGIDFEGVANTKPDVILAAYSGLTQEDYDKLSKIAPTVAFPTAAWATAWRDTIKLESQALGLSAEGDKLIADLEAQMKADVAEYPALAGKSVMFVTHIDPADLSKISYYTTKDTRVQFFTDLGLKQPASVEKASAASELFALDTSAEQIETFNDVDIIVTYGDAKLVSALQANPLLAKMPAIKNGAVVALDGSGPAGTAANPTPLAIPYVTKDYVKQLADAAAKVK
ncbi:iron-siderophore ABC transporter substrate-binding protein [Symbioplanes lichenis]|uniref:iron-siderophore ABC transporter substrate-binding protein n=1 Tax=Symbioplanes lichenis TaxID=1629072 RepID=UPI0027386600|nr:iron-siderophore ABC transporter substrate-binding protein [Actinoplanes lichenis]